MTAGVRLWLLRLGLALPTLLLLLSLEVGARLHAWYSDQTLRAGLEGVGSGPTADDLSLQHLIRWSPNPRVIYELIPGLTGEFRGHRLTVNSRGFRSPEVAETRSPGGLRIIGIGDSVMFGWGVGDEENYLAKLGGHLSSQFPDRQVDWINSAVPGYNTVNEVAVLEEKLLAYEPDIVIVGYVNNDLFVPGFIRKPQPYFALNRSFLAQLVRNAIDGLHVPENELQRPPDSFRHRTFDGETELIPDQYRDLIGIDAFESAVVRLLELSAQRKFQLLFIAHFGVDPAVAAVLKKHGIRVIDGYPRAQAWLELNGFDDYRGSPLTVSERDDHPSALQHGLLAEQLFEVILENPPPAISGPITSGRVISH